MGRVTEPTPVRQLGVGPSHYPRLGPSALPDLRRPDVAHADEFRKRAEECRQLAEKMSNAVDKAFWLRLAQDWMNIALESERVTKS